MMAAEAIVVNRHVPLKKSLAGIFAGGAFLCFDVAPSQSMEPD